MKKPIILLFALGGVLLVIGVVVFWPAKAVPKSSSRQTIKYDPVKNLTYFTKDGATFAVVGNHKPPERAIVTKAESIVLPEFKLDGVTLSEALRQLSSAGKQNDPESKGVRFIITEPAMAAANPKITLALKNVTLEEATGRIAMAARLSVSVQDYAFIFNPKPFNP